jgi:hypothetical protein
VYDLVELEKRGIPTVDIVTDRFEHEAHTRALGLGLIGLATAVVPAELSQADRKTLDAMVDEAMPKIIYGLTRPVPASKMERAFKPAIIEINAKEGEDILETWFTYAMDRKWSDGFPLIPPTEERVKAMLKGTKRKPDELVADVPPYYTKGTVEKIAINSVMAGAKPEYLDVIMAAVEAISDYKVHLDGSAATTDPGNAPLIVINGPIVKELGLNHSWSVMGPGNRANSTIGRALSLCIRNIGGNDTPGGFQQHTYYLPADYSMVLSQDYPKLDGDWDLMSVQLGFKPEQNVVFVMPTQGPISISPFDSPTQPISGEGLLRNFADKLAELTLQGGGRGTGIVMFAPEHARILAADGYTSKKVKEYLLNTGVRAELKENMAKNGLTTRGPKITAKTMGLTRRMMWKPSVKYPIINGETADEDLFILVAGAPVGGHGAFIGKSSHGGWAAREIKR